MMDNVSLFKLITPDFSDQIFTKTAAGIDVISQQVENVITKHKMPLTFLVGLQNYTHLNGQGQRYQNLSETAERVVIFGVADDDSVPQSPNLRYVPLKASTPLAQERFFIVNTPEFYTALIAREIDPDPQSGARRFEGLWTYDEQLVNQAYLMLSLMLGDDYHSVSQRDYRRQNRYVAEISNSLLNHAEKQQNEGKPALPETLTRGFDSLKRDLSAHPEVSNAVLDSISAHISVIDKEGYILDVNEAWQGFAWDNSEIAPINTGIGTNYLDVCRTASGDWSEEAPLAYRGLKKVIDGELASFDLEYPCHSPTEQRWFLMRAVPLDDGSGGVVISHINITHLKQSMENNIEKLRESIQSQQSGKKSNIDPNDLMARIQSMNKLASMLPSLGGLSATQAEAVNRINQLNYELNNLVSNLITEEDETGPEGQAITGNKSKADILHLVSQNKPEMTTVNLQSILDKVIEPFKPLAAEKQIQLNTDVAANLRPVEGNAEFLQYAVAEMLDNALKYNPPGTHVTLVAGTHKGSSILAVRDNGPGIPTRDLPHLYSEGFRRQDEATQAIPGEGLGLTIVQTVAESHGGRSMVDSRLNRGGSIFVLKLPSL